MRLGKDLIGKIIISVTDGRNIGMVKDIYVDKELRSLTGIHIGREGLIKRKTLLIPHDSVVIFGIDAILVKNNDVIVESQETTEFEEWELLSKLRGRDVDTPGGTKVGTVGDIILGEEGHITGFSLAKVFVEGPVAQQGTVPRDALVDAGDVDGVMTVDLPKIEGILQGETPGDEKSE